MEILSEKSAKKIINYITGKPHRFYCAEMGAGISVFTRGLFNMIETGNPFSNLENLGYNTVSMATGFYVLGALMDLGNYIGEKKYGKIPARKSKLEEKTE